MDFLVSTYGYASTGESFSIADRDELWYMELIGKGRFAKGAVWVARKVNFRSYTENIAKCIVYKPLIDLGA